MNKPNKPKEPSDVFNPLDQEFEIDDEQDNNEQHKCQTNKIVIADVLVETSEPLDRCLATIDLILEKHKDFIIQKQIERRLNTSVGIG